MATSHRTVATLQIITGPLTGRLFKIDRDVVIIGRNPDCDLVLEPMSISRRHASIVQRNGDYLLEDIGSTQGTYVNGQKLTQGVILENGCTIRIGQLQMTFHLMKPKRAHRPAPKAGLVDPEPEKLGTNFREALSCRSSLVEECEAIRSSLGTSHVKWDDAERHGAIEDILKRDSIARTILGRGFYRVIVLDAAPGLDGARFELRHFLAAVRDNVVQAFGLRLDRDAFHIEDIFQMLKDEPPSLFCFVNFQLIPAEHLRIVRGFTQGVHRVLLLTRGRRDLASEEGVAQKRTDEDQDPDLEGDDDGDEADDTVFDQGDSIDQESVLMDAIVDHRSSSPPGSDDSDFLIVKPEVKLQALRLISQELAGTLVLSEVLDRIFNLLFEIFPRAERGFVLLKDPVTDSLLPEIVRSRTGPAGELKISKTILNRVLNAGQAILCKDLAQEFPECASVSDSRIRSLMCAPLFDHDRQPVGIIQIDTRDGRGRFAVDDLNLLAAVASQIGVAVQNAQLHKALIKQREMEQELLFARQVMQSLLPERPASVPGYEFWAYYEPARHVGGDYYGFIPISPPELEEGVSASRWAVVVGDVVGRGMPAALLTAKLSAEVRMFLRGNPDPAHVVEQLNRQFNAGGLLDLYITFLLVVLDVDHHRLSVVNAGHPCPLIRRRDGKLEEFGKAISGLPLGIEPDYRYEAAQTTLEPGETVVLYTDGVTDAMNAAGKRLGEAVFQESLLAAKPGAAAAGEEVVKAIQRHLADRPQSDDITLVCLARK